MNAPSGRGRAARIWRVTAAVLVGLLITAALGAMVLAHRERVHRRLKGMNVQYEITTIM